MSQSIQSDISKLRPESQALIHRMLDQELDKFEIRRAVFRLTGERVLLPALSQYAEEYTQRNQPRRQARAHADDFIRLVGKKGVKVSELLRAVLIETLTLAKKKKLFTKSDLYKLDDAERKRREFELKQKQARASTRQKKKEFELKERQAQLAERQYELERKKAQATVDQLESKARAGQPLSPNDVRRIREIYGLSSAASAQEDLSSESSAQEEFDDDPQPQTDDSEPEPSDGSNDEADN